MKGWVGGKSFGDLFLKDYLFFLGRWKKWLVAKEVCGGILWTRDGSQFDIHTGGIDLDFPHHDNKTAQSKAYFDPDSWVINFLHSVHLTIGGCKMSKALKKIVTLQQVLEKYGPTKIRLLFLLHSWSTTFDYSDHEMEKASNYEETLNKFFFEVKTLLYSIDDSNNSNTSTKDNERDLILNKDFSTAEKQINLALCDFIDTPSAMENIRQLMLKTIAYMNTKNVAVNCLLLRKIAAYITRLITIFGLHDSVTFVDDIGFSRSTEQQASTINMENIVMPHVEQFASLDDAVHTQKIAGKSKIVTSGDRVIGQLLSESGVRLEDQDGTKKATIKYCHPDVLKSECKQ
ncbi:unnamed protein product [Rotaria sordida]|uniref:tRNA synthetases class I catalytic domain-containing protein n=1 Tax=Rotaria sordida TaxID=392033 RepID=A0A814N6W7_9BILA|nr:unnamed protein product [Rotaria sordida]CAF1437354.1 unnamed protein product [Rotaria sordida]